MIAQRPQGDEAGSSSQDPMELDVNRLSPENQAHIIQASEAYVALSHSFQESGSKKKKKVMKTQIVRIGEFLTEARNKKKRLKQSD